MNNLWSGIFAQNEFFRTVITGQFLWCYNLHWSSLIRIKVLFICDLTFKKSIRQFVNRSLKLLIWNTFILYCVNEKTVVIVLLLMFIIIVVYSDKIYWHSRRMPLHLIISAQEAFDKSHAQSIQRAKSNRPTMCMHAKNVLIHIIHWSYLIKGCPSPHFRPSSRSWIDSFVNWITAKIQWWSPLFSP